MKKHMKVIETPQVNSFAEVKMTKTEISDVTLCPYKELPAMACCKRECEKCGVERVSDHLTPVKKKASPLHGTNGSQSMLPKKIR